MNDLETALLCGSQNAVQSVHSNLRCFVEVDHAFAKFLHTVDSVVCKPCRGATRLVITGAKIKGPEANIPAGEVCFDLRRDGILWQANERRDGRSCRLAYGDKRFFD